MSNLNRIYQEKIVPKFLEKGYKNKMAVPKVIKVVINIGIGKQNSNPGYKQEVAANLAKITGQKPAIRKARKAISGFKVKIGDEVGLIVTLRGQKMYDFLQKLANITLPRIRDFRGIDPKSIDEHGNLNLGIKEHIVFPEISHEVTELHGLGITINTNAKSPDAAQQLLEALGFPFKKEKNG